MDKAREAVKKFTSKSGQHDTTIHEKIAPAVTNETVERREHEEATTAIDREVHQDHYHTSEQPVLDKQVLPEQHHHQMAEVEHRSFEHDDADAVKRRLAEEQSRYRDNQSRVEGEHTQSAAPTVGGEHVHHHVHETIQPVINRQTVEPHVVHTTVPIHEVHHNAAQHHSASALPAVSMDDFKKQGGSLTGREERHDAFSGEPKAFGGHLRSEHEHGHEHGHSTTGSGMGSTMGSTGNDNYVGSTTGYGNSSGMGSNTGYGNEGDVSGSRTSGTSGLGSTGTGHDSNTTQSFGHMTDGSQVPKPSMMDKLNPKVDSNNDGKPGFMK